LSQQLIAVLRLKSQSKEFRTMNKSTTCNLNGLPCGQSACIEGVNVKSDLQTRLVALGLQKGKLIEVIRRAKLGGPLHIRLGTTEIILRQQEAAHIKVNFLHGLTA
jgi:ferrous iron transport protein A